MSVANTLVFSSSAVQIGDDPKVSTNDKFTTVKERQWRDVTREINNSATVKRSDKKKVAKHTHTCQKKPDTNNIGKTGPKSEWKRKLSAGSSTCVWSQRSRSSVFCGWTRSRSMVGDHKKFR